MYLIDFGEFGDMNFSSLEYFIFIIAVLFIPLIMFNMLIAIMGDTYDRVKEDSIKRDYHELVWLLYEYEVVGNILRCRKGRKWSYLFYSNEKKTSEKAAVNW